MTNTGNWPPGILNLEVVVADANGNVESSRFWINIPYTPPSDPEADEPPRFEKVLHFREEFGLDLDLNGDEEAITERIFNLIGGWYNPHTPSGEVARATWERWGVPLRAVDAAELEYRQAYIAQAATIIPQWVEAHAPSTYAGYYVDHRQGGIIYVGFTSNQANLVAQLKSEAGLMASSRVAGFPSEPQHSYGELLAVQAQVAEHAASLPAFTQAPLDAESNDVRVGTTSSVGSMTEALSSLLGPAAPVTAFFDTEPPGANSGRDRLFGRVRAGDHIQTDEYGCTAIFGTWLLHTTRRGERVYKHFLLTAGHCAGLLEKFYRYAKNPNSGYWEERTLGRVRRQGVGGTFPQVDGLAILLQGKADAWAPRQIYLSPKHTQPITGVTVPTVGMIVSTSGVTTDKVETGEVLGPPVPFNYSNVAGLTAYEVPISIRERHGDSGAPVWQAGTGNAVGLWNAGVIPSYVTPLLEYPGAEYPGYPQLGNPAPGALPKLGFEPGNLSRAR